MSGLWANTIGALNTVLYTNLGIPTPEKIILGFIVFVAVILLWIGSSMILGELVSPSNREVNFGRGGICAVVGLSMMLGVNIYRSYQ
jgi:hypothetical protein